VAYWEIQPISENFEAEAMTVNKLDRQLLKTAGMRPEQAMAEAREWVVSRSGGRRPVMVASPVGFDWMFIHWYFMKFLGASPFGHSSAFDLKTALSVRFDRPIATSGRKNLPEWMGSDIPHSHDARDDARKQAEEFQTLRGWAGPNDRGEQL
jgi:hypothetical protein